MSPGTAENRHIKKTVAGPIGLRSMAEGRIVPNQGRTLDEMSIEEVDIERAKLRGEIARLKANDGKVVPLRVVGDDD